MITKLHIEGFKRFTSCELAFAPLTVLTGLNGAGKTTILQSLLLARESSLHQAEAVLLNGPYDLELGTAADVLNVRSAEDSSEIRLHVVVDDEKQSLFVLDARNEKLQYLPIKRKPTGPGGALAGTNREFTYLCAERLGPRDVLEMTARPTDDLGVGVNGEYCAQVLDAHGLNEKEKVPEKRRHPLHRDEVDAFLKYQTEAWLSDIVRPIEIETVSFPGTAIMALRFRSPGGESVRAPNMGFGVSYSLPIILAGLFAPVGGLVIVENPEAHLHPAGQSRMGVFLATMAAAGVQMVVETHSDHVLNGIRRAIGEHQVLDAANAIVHFFDSDDKGNPLQSTLRFTKSGNLNDWPKRFFDQYQIDVAALSRVRRGPPR